MSETLDMGYIANLSGLSTEARKCFRHMNEPEWIAWHPRYLAVIALAAGKAVILSDITWYEQALLTALWSAPCNVTRESSAKTVHEKSSQSPHKD
jgi:hypothetical protein